MPGISIWTWEFKRLISSFIVKFMCVFLCTVVFNHNKMLYVLLKFWEITTNYLFNGNNLGYVHVTLCIFWGHIMNITQIAKFMGPTWGPPGSCRSQMDPGWPHEPWEEAFGEQDDRASEIVTIPVLGYWPFQFQDYLWLMYAKGRWIV